MISIINAIAFPCPVVEFPESSVASRPAGRDRARGPFSPFSDASAVPSNPVPFSGAVCQWNVVHRHQPGHVFHKNGTNATYSEDRLGPADFVECHKRSNIIEKSPFFLRQTAHGNEADYGNDAGIGLLLEKEKKIRLDK